MFKYLDIYRRGKKFYVSKSFQGKIYNTSLYEKAEDAVEAFIELIKNLQKIFHFDNKKRI